MTEPPLSTDYISVELAVNTCKPEDENNLMELIEKTKGVRVLNFDTSRKTVILGLAKFSDIGIVYIQDRIEKSIGLTTVIKGIGNVLSAVSELRPSDTNESDEKIFGVIRFSQLPNKICYADGLIDGFSTQYQHKKIYSAAIHEYGDLSGSNHENLGNSIIDLKRDITIPEMPSNTKSTSTAISFKKEIQNCDLASLIGRGVAICDKEDKSSERIVSAGIISRASKIGGNPKQICACSGKTIWHERLDRVDK